MVFSDNVYGKEGKRFFPGTFHEAEELINAFPTYGDKDFLFRVYKYPPLFKYEIESWSYSEFTCSTLYYYLNTLMVTENINEFSWKLIAKLILNTVISRDVFSFVNKHNLVVAKIFLTSHTSRRDVRDVKERNYLREFNILYCLLSSPRSIAKRIHPYRM